jgi:hypothetical protein
LRLPNLAIVLAINASIRHDPLCKLWIVAAVAEDGPVDEWRAGVRSDGSSTTRRYLRAGTLTSFWNPERTSKVPVAGSTSTWSAMNALSMRAGLGLGHRVSIENARNLDAAIATFGELVTSIRT